MDGRDPALPPVWLEQGVSLRPRRATDIPFLRVLYRSTRWQEAMAARLDPLSATLFLDGQFDLQCRHYDAHYLMGGRRLIVDAGGTPIGRVELWDNLIPGAGPDLRLVDISLLPDWRGRGLGAALVGSVRALARAEGRSVSLHVKKDSRAARLYRRQGFVVTGDAGDSWRMDWRAADAGGPAVGRCARR